MRRDTSSFITELRTWHCYLHPNGLIYTLVLWIQYDSNLNGEVKTSSMLFETLLDLGSTAKIILVRHRHRTDVRVVYTYGWSLRNNREISNLTRNLNSPDNHYIGESTRRLTGQRLQALQRTRKLRIANVKNPLADGNANECCTWTWSETRRSE